MLFILIFNIGFRLLLCFFYFFVLNDLNNKDSSVDFYLVDSVFKDGFYVLLFDYPSKPARFKLLHS